MVPEVAITEAVIDAFNSSKDLKDMRRVYKKTKKTTGRGQSGIETAYYFVQVGRALGSESPLSAHLPHPDYSSMVTHLSFLPAWNCLSSGMLTTILPNRILEQAV
jgi:hypothetical protein